MQTAIHRAFAPMKRVLPRPVANSIRNVVTAGTAPILHYYQSGHFRSCFAMRAVDKRGQPLPWYSYPCVDFLSRRTFADRAVLEFGAGQSTLWWGQRASSVLAFDGNEQWLSEVKRQATPNVELQLHQAGERG